MRARNLKPGLFENEILGEADPLITILFEGLWCMADRDGRLEDRPKKIGRAIFRYRPNVDADPMLAFLAENGFIIRYEVDGRRLIQIVTWKRHQAPHHKEKPSELPPVPKVAHACPKHDSSMTQACRTLDNPISLTPDSGFLTPDTGFMASVDAQSKQGQSKEPLSEPPEEPKPPPIRSGAGFFPELTKDAREVVRAYNSAVGTSHVGGGAESVVTEILGNRIASKGDLLSAISRWAPACKKANPKPDKRKSAANWFRDECFRDFLGDDVPVVPVSDEAKARLERINREMMERRKADEDARRKAQSAIAEIGVMDG